MTKKWIFFAALIMTLANCRGQGREPSSTNAHDPAKFELAVYTAPTGMQQALSDILNRSFSAVGGKDRSRVARVEVLPNGQLALLGPASVHEGMANLIESLAKAKVPPPENAALSLWILLAKPADRQSLGPGLTGLEDVVQELDTNENKAFYLLEKLKNTSAIGTRASTVGNFFVMECGLFETGVQNVVELDIRAQDGPHQQLQTRVYFKPDQTMVLGESKYFLRQGIAERLDGIGEGHYTLYYVLKTEEP